MPPVAVKYLIAERALAFTTPRLAKRACLSAFLLCDKGALRKIKWPAIRWLKIEKSNA